MFWQKSSLTEELLFRLYKILDFKIGIEFTTEIFTKTPYGDAAIFVKRGRNQTNCGYSNDD